MSYVLYRGETMEILNVKKLSKKYGKGENEFLALNNVSFRVQKGEFIVIVGKSGSGKSTLLHLLGGLDKPSSGSVFINNQDINMIDYMLDDLFVSTKNEETFNIVTELLANSKVLMTIFEGTGIISIGTLDIAEIEIELPSIDKQKEIIEINSLFERDIFIHGKLFELKQVFYKEAMNKILKNC